MSSATSSSHGGQEVDQRAYSYLVGIGVSHSIAAPMHDYISKALGYNWTFISRDCATAEEAMGLFRQPTFAGGVVTMPFKGTIMSHLDGLDEYVTKIGACNNVYRASDGSLRGTNTDWRGIEGCLLGASEKGKGRPALIIGAGGASRAAIYALHERLGCNLIYVVNRDDDEVNALRNDCQTYGGGLDLDHVQTVDQAAGISPYYIVGTVPDFEPKSPSELAAQDILNHILSSAEDKGVLLDMCYKPRRTRKIKLAQKYGWHTVEGTGVVGHQIKEQYRLWCGEEESQAVPTDGAWAVLEETAKNAPGINY